MPTLTAPSVTLPASAHAHQAQDHPPFLVLSPCARRSFLFSFFLSLFSPPSVCLLGRLSVCLFVWLVGGGGGRLFGCLCWAVVGWGNPAIYAHPSCRLRRAHQQPPAPVCWPIYSSLPEFTGPTTSTALYPKLALRRYFNLTTNIYHTSAIINPVFILYPQKTSTSWSHSTTTFPWCATSPQ